MAEREEESQKKHGDEMQRAMEDTDRHADAGAGSLPGSQPDPIPMPEHGGHEKSHAAHLGHTHEHTKPAGDLRKNSPAPGELREPPMVVQRVGKEHRKQ